MGDLLHCIIMPYAWGSRTALAALQGRPSPSPSPEAELWMGAHPIAPSRLVRGGETLSLGDVIAAAPERELGREVARAFGPRLPFLLKPRDHLLRIHPQLDYLERDPSAHGLTLFRHPNSAESSLADALQQFVRADQVTTLLSFQSGEFFINSRKVRRPRSRVIHRAVHERSVAVSRPL